MDSCRTKSRIIRRVSLMMGLLLLLAGCATGPSPQQDPEAEQPSGMTTIEQLATVSRPESAEIQIQTSGEVDYTSVKQLEPLGVIFYFPQAQLGELDRQYQPEDKAIEAVLLSSSEDRRNVRVEVQLARDMNYTVDKQAAGLTIQFDKKDLPDPAGSEAAPQLSDQTRDQGQQPRLAESRYKKGFEPERKTDSDSPKTTAEVYKDIATVKDIHFASGESGASVITIRTSRPVDYDLDRARDRLLKLRLIRSALPDHVDRRPLITTRFDSAVDRVIPYAVPEKKGLVEMIIELREAVPYRVAQEGRELMIHFEASSVGPRPYPVADLPEWQQVLEEVLTEEAIAEAGLSSAAEAARKAEKQVDWLFEKDEYTGEKIALDFYETDIKNVFRILQQVSGKNYAIDPDVQGKVTINMEKPVPWDQVLALILKQNRLGKVEQDEIIRIATLETLRQEEEARRQRVEAYKNRIEQEKAMEPLVTEYIPVSYASAQGEVLPHIEDVLSDRGKANVDNRNNQLIITDTMERIDKAQEVISKIDKVTPQVEIEARIVEINEDFLKDVGTSFDISKQSADAGFGGSYLHNISMNHPSTNTTSGIGFSLSRLSGLTLDAQLNALEEENNVKIVSAPKIVTLDNKKATIKQGFEIPYQTVEDDEVNIEFKEVDLRLDVTPHVTPDQRVSLQIFVTKNEIAELTQEAPALSTNEAVTELLVEDGDTIVIGGIKKDTTTKRKTGFPILKDIPILGWMFKRDIQESEKSELLIFMTPRIVQLEQRKMTATASDDN